MKLFNEVAAGERASHIGAQISDAKQRALQALRDGRFSDYDSAISAAYDLGCKDDLEAWAANIVSDEIAAERR